METPRGSGGGLIVIDIKRTQTDGERLRGAGRAGLASAILGDDSDD